MANNDNGSNWNSFMQEKRTQVVLYGICVFFCLFYAIDGVRELLTPERVEQMVAIMGAPGYYAMTIVRTVVLLITAVAFGRIAYKAYKEQ
ncbi:MAG: hypothetical protein Q4A01_12625 [Coriobacteriales bacterium]|nr:hypothetical protein [Coriobacteriales bacterium]